MYHLWLRMRRSKGQICKSVLKKMNVTGYATLTTWMHTREQDMVLSVVIPSNASHTSRLLAPRCEMDPLHNDMDGFTKSWIVQGNFLWEFHETPKLHSLFFLYCKNTPFRVGPTIKMHQLTKVLTFFVRICSAWVCFLPLAQLMRQKIHHENHCWQFLQHSDQHFFGWLHDHILFLWV